MATVQEQAPADQRMLLYGISWEAYVGIGEYLLDQPIRINYCEGTLEIIAISREHERSKTLLARLVEILTEELGIDIGGGGSTTLRRQLKARGLEPDECYWIAHERQMRHRDSYEPDVDPPPDLALEVEIPRSVLDRLDIFAALAVPEIWRYDGAMVHYMVLGPDGYEVSSSRTFPYLSAADLARFVGLRSTLSDTQIAQQFRAWIRDQIGAGLFPAPNPKPAQ